MLLTVQLAWTVLQLETVDQLTISVHPFLSSLTTCFCVHVPLLSYLFFFIFLLFCYLKSSEEDKSNTKQIIYAAEQISLHEVLPIPFFQPVRLYIRNTLLPALTMNIIIRCKPCAAQSSNMNEIPWETGLVLLSLSSPPLSCFLSSPLHFTTSHFTN